MKGVIMEKQQPRKAALLSIIPGLGQIYNKQKAKGFIFLGVTTQIGRASCRERV